MERDFFKQNDAQMNELDDDIKKLRCEIGKKMDSYFILDKKDVYDSMMDYSAKLNKVNDTENGGINL